MNELPGMEFWKSVTGHTSTSFGSWIRYNCNGLFYITIPCFQLFQSFYKVSWKSNKKIFDEISFLVILDAGEKVFKINGNQVSFNLSQLDQEHLQSFLLWYIQYLSLLLFNIEEIPIQIDLSFFLWTINI